MGTDQFTVVLAPEAETGSILASKTIFRMANPINLLRTVSALMVWAAIICLISVVYEIWRLEKNWRVGIKLIATCANP